MDKPAKDWTQIGFKNGLAATFRRSFVEVVEAIANGVGGSAPNQLLLLRDDLGMPALLVLVQDIVYVTPVSAERAHATAAQKDKRLGVSTEAAA